jgi:hypothetical protein
MTGLRNRTATNGKLLEHEDTKKPLIYGFRIFVFLYLRAFVFTKKAVCRCTKSYRAQYKYQACTAFAGRNSVSAGNISLSASKNVVSAGNGSLSAGKNVVSVGNISLFAGNISLSADKNSVFAGNYSIVWHKIWLYASKNGFCKRNGVKS